jgi:hypothetical protein
VYTPRRFDAGKRNSRRSVFHRPIPGATGGPIDPYGHPHDTRCRRRDPRDRGFRICRKYNAPSCSASAASRPCAAGWYWNIPLLEWQRKLDLRTCTVDIEQQETVSRDSVTIKVNAVLWYRIFDPERAVIAVEDYGAAVYQVALTSLRNIIGQHDLDDVLKSRDRINQTLREMVDAATDPWGLKVEMVEMKDVEIPARCSARWRARPRRCARSARASSRRRRSWSPRRSCARLRSSSRRIRRRWSCAACRWSTEVGAEHNTTTLVMMPARHRHARAQRRRVPREEVRLAEATTPARARASCRSKGGSVPGLQLRQQA